MRRRSEQLFLHIALNLLMRSAIFDDLKLNFEDRWPFSGDQV